MEHGKPVNQHDEAMPISARDKFIPNIEGQPGGK